ncbi:MAG: phenylalanine--tRNA ligase subunit beta [Gammaproteobacteria bacterium]|nr:phenylalanine--tRNA ligase subunit beta [Gammaproteobacteria bacterium]
MKISEKWLRSWIDPEIDTEKLCDQLTNLGLEVDGREFTYANLSGVSVAEIKSIEKVDGTDGKAITNCTLDTGRGSVQVICGAPNVRVGMKSAYAKDGASLNEKDHVKKARLYGVESDGMLCSGVELGISADASGILDLSEDLQVGVDVKDALDLHDVVIDIDLTPNRGDCLSIRGIARELGVVNQLPVHQVDIESVVAQVSQELPIELANPNGCPRYLGRVITNIDPSASTPAWMVQRLVGCGLRPIDPVVDVTNYVMLELGQPLHAFDLTEVRNGIVVRDANEGEKLTLLDGTEIKFDAGTLLITDGDTPLAIAGVMGGERSGIRDDTKNVFLECAYFTPEAIVGTPRLYGLQTDASLRYERGVDPELQYEAIERATRLLCEVVGGQPGPVTVAESSEHIPNKRTVELRKERLAMLIGEKIADSEVEDIFARLGLEIESDSDGWRVSIPSYRFDLSIEEDLVEEICRVHGYNRISASHPVASLPFDVELDRISESLALRNRIAELGYYEVINYSFIEKELNDRFTPAFQAPQVENPIASQYESMRKSLVPGLIDSARHNLSRQQETVRLFEHGKCFSIENGHTRQSDRIAGIALGLSRPEGWATPQRGIDFYDVKGDVERVLALLGTDALYERSDSAFLHPGQAARIVIKSGTVGSFGKLHPEITMAMELPEETFVFELDAEPFVHIGAPQAEHVAPFPYVRRDLALLVSGGTPVQDLCLTIRDELSDLLSDLTVFDLYEGENVEAHQKSVGIGLLLQDKKSTLTDETVAARIESLLKRLASQFNVTRR